MAAIIVLISIGVLLGFSAYLAAAETSLMRVNRIRVRFLAEKKEKNAELLQRTLEETNKFFTAILLTVLLVQITAASLAAWLAQRAFGNIGVVIGTAILTVVLFIFGELIPKAYASHHAEKVSLGVVKFVHVLSIVCRPITWLLVGFADLFLKAFSQEVLSGKELISEGEIMTLVDVAEEREVIEEEEREMIHSIFEFGDTVVREVMVPRPDMVCLEHEDTLRDAMEPIVGRGFSRIPMYREDLDNIIGIIYAKDLIKSLRDGELENPVRELAREAYFIPETKKVSELLRELRNRKVHMAIVIDEYGTTAGLVTIEDLIEEIVGEIFDEYDREVVMVEELEDGTFLVNAKIAMDDLKDLLGVDLPHEGIDTLGGLVFNVLGKVPSQGEKFTYQGMEFTVVKVYKHRIYRVMIKAREEKS